MEVASTTKPPHVKKMNSMKDYNIVLLGQGGVGKSGNLQIHFTTHFARKRDIFKSSGLPGVVF